MASDLKSKAGAVLKRIEENWDTDAVPISWPGRPFDPPDGPWMRVTILWGDGTIATIGGAGSGAENDIAGVLVAQLFDRPGGGAGAIESYADDFRDLFNRIEVEGVRFDAPSGPKAGPGRANIGPETDERWIQRTVDVPFEAEDEI